MVDLARRKFFGINRNNVHRAIRLPYVINESTFINKCTQCENCITACPENIIVKGDGGFPEVNFEKGECTFCNECVNTCEAPIFSQSKDEKAWDLNIEIKANCLALNNVYCLSCQDSCETEAITFLPIANAAPQPQISLDNCNDCGACVSACPQGAIELSPKTKFLNTIGEAHERS